MTIRLSKKKNGYIIPLDRRLINISLNGSFRLHCSAAMRTPMHERVSKRVKNTIWPLGIGMMCVCVCLWSFEKTKIKYLFFTATSSKSNLCFDSFYLLSPYSYIGFSPSVLWVRIFFFTVFSSFSVFVSAANYECKPNPNDIFRM